MAELIPRNLGTPFDPEDPLDVQELDEFMCPPDTAQIFLDLFQGTPDSRALRLFDPGLIQGLIPPGVDPGEDAPDVPLVADILPTPDAVAPALVAQQFDRRGLHDALDTPFVVPNLGEIEIWSFRDNIGGGAPWPATTIRAREDRIYKTLMGNRRGPHTIHHHGIEPTSANDGVGHLTFDVGGGVLYNYQWQASEAGTYFYHCHVNTTLHFEMGMYGMLIIDPDVPGAPFADGGPGATYVANTIENYDKEAFWVADDIDRTWHARARHGHDRRAGIECGTFLTIQELQEQFAAGDGLLLHDFNPEVFVVSGVAAAWNPALNRTEPNALIALDPDAQGSIITPRVQRGQKILVRALNASYTTTRWRFLPGGPQNNLLPSGTVTAVDGRTLGRLPFGRYSQPFSLASINHQFQLTTAQRWDILIDTTGLLTGQYETEISFYHWITNNHIQTVRTQIIVDA